MYVDVKVGVSQQYNIYSKTATFLGKAEKTYLGLAVALATWYNLGMIGEVYTSDKNRQRKEEQT